MEVGLRNKSSLHTNIWMEFCVHERTNAKGTPAHLWWRVWWKKKKLTNAPNASTRQPWWHAVTDDKVNTCVKQKQYYKNNPPKLKNKTARNTLKWPQKHWPFSSGKLHTVTNTTTITKRRKHSIAQTLLYEITLPVYGTITRSWYTQTWCAWH